MATLPFDTRIRGIREGIYEETISMQNKVSKIIEIARKINEDVQRIMMVSDPRKEKIPPREVARILMEESEKIERELQELSDLLKFLGRNLRNVKKWSSRLANQYMD